MGTLFLGVINYLLNSVVRVLLSFVLSRDGKMGRARRNGPPAQQKKHGSRQEIQPANLRQPDLC